MQQATAKFGAGSPQAIAAEQALQSTAAKWLPGVAKTQDTKGVETHITSLEGKVSSEQSKLDSLTKDSSVKATEAKITEGNSHLLQMTAKLQTQEGDLSAIHSAVKDTGATTHQVETRIESLRGSVVTQSAKLDALNKDATAKETEGKISDGTAQLRILESRLATERTLGASSDAIQQTKDQISQQKSDLDQARDHLSAIHTAQSSLAKDETELHNNQALLTKLENLHASEAAVKASIDQTKSAIDEQRSDISQSKDHLAAIHNAMSGLATDHQELANAQTLKTSIDTVNTTDAGLRSRLDQDLGVDVRTMPSIVFPPLPVPKVTVNVSTAGAANTPTAVAQNLAAAGFADGGIITSPTLAVIGEAGAAEAVIPGDDPSRAMQLFSQLFPNAASMWLEGARAGDLPGVHFFAEGGMSGGTSSAATSGRRQRQSRPPRARRARTQTRAPAPPTRRTTSSPRASPSSWHRPPT